MEAEQGLPLPQRYWAILVVALGITLAVLDGAIANVALPTIARTLNATPADSIWVVNAYQLTITISLLPLASLGDRIGYRRIYMAGLALFTLASFGCALSGSLVALTITRVVQGFGAAGIMSVNTALVRMIYPPDQLGRGVSINATVVAISSVIGPTVASGVLAVAPWPWLFAINVPIGLAALAVGTRALPRTPGPSAALRLRQRDHERARLRPCDHGGRRPRPRRASSVRDRGIHRGRRDRLFLRATPVDAKRAAAARRPDAHSGVRALHRDVVLFVHRADADLRLAAFPVAGRLRHDAGADRFPDDAVAARDRIRRAACRCARGSLLGGDARRHRARDPDGRPPAARNDRPASDAVRHRLADGASAGLASGSSSRRTTGRCCRPRRAIAAAARAACSARRGCPGRRSAPRSSR